MVSLLPERSAFLDNATKNTLQSDDEDFYGHISSNSSLEKSFESVKISSNEDGEKDNPSLS